MGHRAVFLDRDGVINVDRHYLHRTEDFAFIAGVPQALQRLQRAGWKLVVVTNQSGIARGYYTEDHYQRLTRHMQALLAKDDVTLDAVLHCPHLPDGSVAAYRIDCDCRKPAPGMLLQAARELNLDLPRSVMVGDKGSDLRAGRNAGVARCLLVRSGQGIDEGDIALADSVHDDLGACADELLGPATPAPSDRRAALGSTPGAASAADT
jgi:D-glycero-D-manno-heptose 1,7-bisphosphate phosphatase